MQFKYVYLYKTSLCLAVEKDNIEIIKLLLSNNNLNVNFGYVLNLND